MTSIQYLYFECKRVINLRMFLFQTMMNACCWSQNVKVMEARWELIPDMCATTTLRELVRMDVAKELTLV